MVFPFIQAARPPREAACAALREARRALAERSMLELGVGAPRESDRCWPAVVATCQGSGNSSSQIAESYRGSNF